MEIIILIAILVGVALWWNNHVKTEKSKIDNDIDNWTPTKQAVSGSENRVEAPAPAVANVTAENKAAEPAATTPIPLIVEQAPAKKAPAKKAAAKPAAKRTPAKPRAKKTPAE
jgi:cytoskeletal protein RodZ